MFFAKLGQGTKDKNHPQNQAASTVIKKELPKPKPKLLSKPVPKPDSNQPKQSNETSKSLKAKQATSKSPAPRKRSPSPIRRVIKKQAKQRPISRGSPPPSQSPALSSDSEDDWDANIKKLSASVSLAEDNDTPDDSAAKRHLFLDRIDDGTLTDLRSSLVHASDLVKTGKAAYKSIFAKNEDSVEVVLELPFSGERYSAVAPVKSDEMSPLGEIEAAFELIATSFVPPEYTPVIKHPSMQDCILRRLRRAVKARDSKAFVAAIDEFNKLIIELRDSGKIEATMRKLDRLPTISNYELLNQVYRRIVSQRVHELRDYKAFSNNVYGELLPRFASQLFRETGLTCESVFVDLGSGVGNCVLQAALEVGCESWGCEIMKTASELADQQKIELESRAKLLYRLRLGSINLRSTDFVNNPEIISVLRGADVVLVNNYAFDAKLNGRLVDMFLDLKDGCKIVSLRSFVPNGHVISEHNIESPLNILRVDKRHFGNDCVSWTTAGGDYYVSTVDRSRLSYSAKTS